MLSFNATEEEEEEKKQFIYQKNWLPETTSAHQRWLRYCDF